jgi:segregation and condensation protein B
VRSVHALARRLPLWKHTNTPVTGTTGQGPLARDPQLAQLEALLFAADEPLPIRRLTSLLRLSSAEEVRRLLKRLNGLYEQDSSSFHLVEIAGGYQLRTGERYVPWLLKLRSPPEASLSAAGRETLTMIAYKQPITRADLEAVRGVACGDVLRALLEKGLIRIVGRDNSLGRPVLYGTTKLFLQMTGLRSLQDLPPLKS